MLTDLTVSDLGVIEQIEVEFETGSTALTGETGAGKTLVVAALGLLLGQRADRSLVRAGADRAVVEGRWVLTNDHPVVPVLVEHGLIEPDEGELELIVNRSVESGGTSRARINGRLVPAKLLDEICGSLVEITGQHLHQKIGEPAWQRALLDRLAGDEAVTAAGEVAAAVAEARSLERRAVELEASARDRERDMDVLRFEIDEISSADLQIGEPEELRDLVSRLEHAETLAGAFERAAEALDGEQGSVAAVLRAENEIGNVLDLDPSLGDLYARLESARLELVDVAAELKDRVGSPDPSGLETARERLGQIARLTRKYGATVSEVLDYGSDAAVRLKELEGNADAVAGSRTRAEVRWKEARSAAERLSELRRVAASDLKEAVQERLHELAMPDARFDVDLAGGELYEGGFERPVFLFSANPGEPERPLSKVASGGEMSRAALALRLVAGRNGITDRYLMVFDEVDSGVGGGAARAVGRCLAELGKTTGAQVIVVTHLPQVAAVADHHLQVTKGTKGSTTRARVFRLEGDARVEEISRMLAGLPESSRAQDHARELLEDAIT